MVRPLRADLPLLVAALVCAGSGCARAPTVVRQPSWTGAAPASGTPSYAETVEALQVLFEEFRQGLPQRVSAPRPCVLRVVRSDEFSAYPRATVGDVYESTWIDLSRVTGVDARPPDRGRATEPTCASFDGARGFALRTEIVARGKRRTARHSELADEKHPRVCVAHRANPERLATPLRHLVKLCGGRP